MFTDVLTGNFLIGLREGLEASLVVAILVAYLRKTGRGDRLPAVAVGVGAAVALSLGFGALLVFTSNELPFKQQELFGGGMSIIAVCFVTWMIFWMKRNSRSLATELHTKTDHALQGGMLAMAATAFLATGREGLETALFLWPSLRASGYHAGTGAVAGIVASVVLAWLIYRRAVHLNLATFFKVTGAGLVVVAAGVLAYGVHDLQEADVVPGLGARAFDVSNTIPPSSWYGTLLKGIFNFQPDPTWLQVVVYLAYLIPVMAIFLLPARGRGRPAVTGTADASPRRPVSV